MASLTADGAIDNFIVVHAALPTGQICAVEDRLEGLSLMSCQQLVSFFRRVFSDIDVSPANLTAMRLQHDWTFGGQRFCTIPIVLHNRAFDDRPFVQPHPRPRADLPNAELVRLRAALPEQVILVVDEAYGEFADGDDARLIPLVEQGRTIILRTFSKAYGLAAARAGWGLFPPQLGGEVRKLIIPSSISSVSAAMAQAAMEDQKYMRETCDLTVQLLNEFCQRVSSNGLRCTDSRTNFVLMEFSSVEDAQSADQALREVGIVMRGMGGYGLPHCLRATVADAPIMQLAAATLEAWAKGDLT